LEELSMPRKALKEEMEKLVREDSLRREDQEFVLTENGRKKFKVVLIGGTFEIIHPGHLYTIEKSRRLGDALVVVIATDRTVIKSKRRKPVTDERLRLKLVSAIKYVNAAILGSEKSIYDTLEVVRPDIVALGYDQRHDEAVIMKEAEKRGIKLSVVRLDTPIPEIKTSKIMNEL
jgi:cytidyltransferase-like protein